MKNIMLPIIMFAALLLVPALSSALVITSDATWSGEIVVSEDTLIPEGVTLTLAPGSVIRVIPSESTKTDPEYLSPQTEFMIRGTLIVDGRPDAPVIFQTPSKYKTFWAGLIVDGGKVILRSCNIHGAETGVEVMSGSASIKDSLISKNRYGVAAYGRGASVSIESTSVKENDCGVMMFNGATFESQNSVIADNMKKSIHSASSNKVSPALREYKASQREVSRFYGDEVLLDTVVWQKRIVIKGIVRVPERSRLIILPGTVIEFARKDTNKDGIGENGLFIQGTIIAKGTRDEPIIFRSAEENRRMGDWDSINIMNSDMAQNLIEHCQIEDAYRGLHFHFSNVAVSGSVVRNNFRGIQFQESIVEIRDTDIYGNKSGLQARDSEIIFSGNTVYRNYTGMNVFRNAIAVMNSSIVNNALEGMRIREGAPVVEGNLIAGNRHGLSISSGVYGKYGRNVISHNLESGLSIKDTENIEISGNVVQANAVNGMNILDSSAFIHGNLISDNGERGIGIVSFKGIITDNNILKNGLYNLGIDGAYDISVQRNWWGGEDLGKTIYDKNDDPGKGRADYQPVLEAPVLIAWPLRTVKTDSSWHGNMLVNDNVTVEHGSTLTISPGTKVLLSKGKGLTVKGKILAGGEKDARIRFTSHEVEEPGAWDEILLDRAEGSSFVNCLFEFGTWALHVHFTKLKIEGCSFRRNYGGMRFASGPVEIRNSLFSDNVIGLRSFEGKARIFENTLTGNETGIFVREKGSGLTIAQNNFSRNAEYNIRLGDFNNEDVHAEDNWWGPGNPLDTIFDDRREPGIGRVIYEPYRTEPVSSALWGVP